MYFIKENLKLRYMNGKLSVTTTTTKNFLPASVSSFLTPHTSLLTRLISRPENPPTICQRHLISLCLSLWWGLQFTLSAVSDPSLGELNFTFLMVPHRWEKQFLLARLRKAQPWTVRRNKQIVTYIWKGWASVWSAPISYSLVIPSYGVMTNQKHGIEPAKLGQMEPVRIQSRYFQSSAFCSQKFIWSLKHGAFQIKLMEIYFRMHNSFKNRFLNRGKSKAKPRLKSSICIMCPKLQQSFYFSLPLFQTIISSWRAWYGVTLLLLSAMRNPHDGFWDSWWEVFSFCF